MISRNIILTLCLMISITYSSDKYESYFSLNAGTHIYKSNYFQSNFIDSPRYLRSIESISYGNLWGGEVGLIIVNGNNKAGMASIGQLLIHLTQLLNYEIKTDDNSIFFFAGIGGDVVLNRMSIALAEDKKDNGFGWHTTIGVTLSLSKKYGVTYRVRDLRATAFDGVDTGWKSSELGFVIYADHFRDLIH